MFLKVRARDTVAPSILYTLKNKFKVLVQKLLFKFICLDKIKKMIISHVLEKYFLPKKAPSVLDRKKIIMRTIRTWSINKKK